MTDKKHALSTNAEPVGYGAWSHFEQKVIAVTIDKMKADAYDGRGDIKIIPLYAAPAVAVKAGPLAHALADELERMGKYRPNGDILHDALSRVLPALSPHAQDVAVLDDLQYWVFQQRVALHTTDPEYLAKYHVWKAVGAKIRLLLAAAPAAKHGEVE